MPNGSAHYLVPAGRNLSLLTKLLCPLVSRSGHGTLLPDDLLKHSLHRCPHSLGCGLRLLGFEKVLDTDLVRRLSHRLGAQAQAQAQALALALVEAQALVTGPSRGPGPSLSPGRGPGHWPQPKPKATPTPRAWILAQAQALA